MQIGILNLHYSNKNYGAVLQAYALLKFLKESGVDARIIDLRPKSIRTIKSFIVNLIVRNPFEAFRKKWLHPMSKPFFSLEELYNADFNDFSCFIVGSDQVWRPKYNFEPLAYFLPFVKSRARKISYAASFGVDLWEKENPEFLTSEVKRLIGLFDAISVREDTGVRICIERFDVNAKHVLDPTLLVGRASFDKVIKSDNILPKNIVYYKLDEDLDFLQSLNFLSQKTGYKIENIYFQRKTILRKQFLKHLSVEKWLKSIRDAELVVTDSYHCICFALLFHKQFIYYPNLNRGFTRLESLLGMLNLKKRIYSNKLDLQERYDWQESIDYMLVEQILFKEREASIKFLIGAINAK